MWSTWLGGRKSILDERMYRGGGVNPSPQAGLRCTLTTWQFARIRARFRVCVHALEASLLSDTAAEFPNIVFPIKLLIRSRLLSSIGAFIAR